MVSPVAGVRYNAIHRDLQQGIVGKFPNCPNETQPIARESKRPRQTLRITFVDDSIIIRKVVRGAIDDVDESIDGVDVIDVAGTESPAVGEDHPNETGSRQS